MVLPKFSLKKFYDSICINIVILSDPQLKISMTNLYVLQFYLVSNVFYDFPMAVVCGRNIWLIF
jgi:hypothetical protein